MTEKIVTTGGESVELKIDQEGSLFRSGGHEIEVVSVHGQEAELKIDGVLHLVPFAIAEGRVSFSLDGEIYSTEVSDKIARGKARHRDHSMAAPMPGLVLKLLVESGSVVQKGAPLIILEAMKMEHQIAAPYDGVVRAVNCREGELVQPGVELIELERSEKPAE